MPWILYVRWVCVCVCVRCAGRIAPVRAGSGAVIGAAAASMFPASQ